MRRDAAASEHYRINIRFANNNQILIGRYAGRLRALDVVHYKSPVANATKAVRWGDWVLARSRVVGFRRQLDLAASIGCSEDTLSAWMQLKEPPKRMRKGFDQSMAAALQTTRETLFNDYTTVSPEEAPRYLAFAPSAMDGYLGELFEVLAPSEREMVAQIATLMVMGKNDRRRPEVERLVRKYQLNSLLGGPYPTIPKGVPAVAK